MKKIILFIMIIMFFSLGCNKDNKPPVGIYEANIKWTSSDGQPFDEQTTLRMDITESNEDLIFIDDTWILEKDGHKIKSKNSYLYSAETGIYTTINSFEGKWKRKIGRYVITGSISGVSTRPYLGSPSSSWNLEGTLEIKSKK